MPEEQKFKLRIMALGARRINRANDWGLAFVKLTELQDSTDPLNLEDYLLYDKKVKKNMGGMPGAIYLVESADEEGKSIYSGTARLEGLWDNATDRATWEASHRALIAELSSKLDDAKEEKHSALFESLDVARTAYARATGINRSQLLAIMVAYITSGTRSTDNRY